ncbi:S-layer homology domain-containing protein [Intestinimonas sp. HCP28S3_D6]|uniref:S-layer homology domain-containing protein n=1 Tax=Intestinimonas sp. HCP28S3_D6 TaxID=3438942 RepID=UPI003F8C7D0B
MKGRFRRIGAFLLLAMLAAMMPQTALTAVAASYTEPYLNQMVGWGFMRGDIDGNLNPDNDITRAEFVTIINRAFGYEKMGSTPFTDVKDTDWYAEDVAIAYTAGYINGTSASTFSPLAEITREEATVILARNLMMQPAVGENTDFTDGRELSNWSSGLVSTAAAYNLISGYPDGSFRPQDPITRGEVAIMVTNAIGTPVQEPGEHTLGNVYGNVVITDSGITLRDTTIAGNLYITAGVDLGDVHLENVTVLGEIVVSGGGVSEGGDDSIVLRNVDAPKLIVDNIKNQLVSLRVEGDGVITTTSVRTDSYLADNTPAGYGLSRIELDGEEGRSLKLAGNVKEVVNLTPKSSIGVAAGEVDTITVDEKATGSTLSITAGAQVGNVNLDVATTVTGDGDIANLTVNADGSTVSMLPDQIVVRPGVTATIDGEQMDSAAAAESSADPRLLAGYPEITDLAPTSATASFSANKRGTVYWAITSVTDGSVGVDDLINPQSYATTIVKQGTVTLGGSNQPGTSKISGLTSDGSYYLSTVFVDARGDQSPLKVISFTTPDNTKPDFASGYPYLSKITNISAQVTAMPTKTCRLYWAVLPKGSAAPTASDFKANAVTGNLGFGTLDVTKNTPYSFDVNSVPLEELESYDLYLWLTDVDGAQSSAVKKLSFTTVDKTPPVFNTEPTINKVDKTSVGMYANLNEAGTLYWVVVAQGEEYPKPLAGQSGAVDLASDTAKLQASAGMNALKSGKVSMTEGKDVTFTISGLEAEKAYDLYYVAQDKAGNYSATVKKITIHTADPNAPTVTQEFTKYNGTDTTTPLPNTDIRLVFSEAVRDAATNTELTKLYEDATQAGSGDSDARNKMANFLRNSIKLYVDTGNGRPETVPEATSGTDKEKDEWVIDYRYAEITMEEGKTVVTFPTQTTAATSALNLQSGVKYYFEIEAGTIADTSETKNIMGKTPLDPFKTVFAIVNLSNPNVTSLGLSDKDEDENRVDVSWTLTPTTTESTADSVDWDMVIWSDTSVKFELYYRDTEPGGQKDWKLLGSESITVPGGTERVGVSLTRHFLDRSNNPDFAQLNTLKESAKYEYAIHFTQIGTLTDPETWSQRVRIGVNILAGTTNDLSALANNLSEDNYETMLKEGLTNIGQPSDFTLTKQFSDQTPPRFASGRPTFTAGSSAVNMSLMLDREGTVYYLIAPAGTVTTEGKDTGGKDVSFGKDNAGDLPHAGEYDSGNFRYDYTFTQPDTLNIIEADKLTSSIYKHGTVSVGTIEETELVDGLQPNQDYIVYFVIQGRSNQSYSQVYAYYFRTDEVEVPYITLEALNPEVAFTTSEDADLDYALFAPKQLPSQFTTKSISYKVSSTSGDETKTMTWLEAMLETYDASTGESYFDHYASEPDKLTVQQIIQRQITSGGTPVDTGDMTTTKEKSQVVDFTDAMKSENADNATYFYCLATAKNILGSGYSFKAVENVHIRDKEPPYLIYVGATIQQGSSKGVYSGTLTLTFNEQVYYMDKVSGGSGADSNTLRPVVANPYGDTKDYISIIAASELTGGTFTTAGYSTTPTNTFTIKFTDIANGASIIFSNKGFVSDASENSIATPFIIQFQEGASGVEGFVQAGKFVVISGDYRPTK